MNITTLPQIEVDRLHVSVQVSLTAKGGAGAPLTAVPNLPISGLGAIND
jgi:hypothetical protein